MFNPHIFSRSQPNPRHKTIHRSLCSHCQYGYKYFSFMSLCKELLNSDLSFTQFQKLFFLMDLLSKKSSLSTLLCIPHFSLCLPTHVVYLYNPILVVWFFFSFFILHQSYVFCHYKINFIK